MFREALTAVLFMGVFIFFLYTGVFENDPRYVRLSNAFFLPGIILFFISIVVVTNASNVFMSVTFTFKKIFSRRYRDQRSTYFDYVQARRQKKKRRYIGVPSLLISLALLVVAGIFAYMNHMQ